MKNLIGNNTLDHAALRRWRPAAVLAGIACALCAANPASAANPTKTIAAGTAISVRTIELIDVLKSDGHVFSGAVDQNVLDESGDIAIPRGSYAKLIVKTVSDRYLALDLELVEVDGSRYVVTTDGDHAASERRAGIGPSPRSGDLVDGRALAGSIAQLFTRGKTVKIPAESFLMFRLARPLAIVEANR